MNISNSVKKRLLKIVGNRELCDLWLHEILSDKAGDTSYAGEMGVIFRLLKNLDIGAGYAVDIAASDGLTQSSTFSLFRRGWSGLCVEMDPVKFTKLSFLYRGFESVTLMKTRVTPNNTNSVLKAAEAPVEFDFLNLDIDSYDLRVMEAVLIAGYKPKLISMEINEKIPAGVYFTVEYSEDHFWRQDHFYGCSIEAANDLLSGYGYALVGLEWNNAFFCPREIMTDSMPTLNLVDAYNYGYRDRPGRTEMFPWNEDVESWLTCSSEEAVKLITEKFSEYEGSFICRVN